MRDKVNNLVCFLSSRLYTFLVVLILLDNVIVYHDISMHNLFPLKGDK